MKVFDAFLLIVGGVGAIIVIALIVAAFVRTRAGVNRREHKRVIAMAERGDDLANTVEDAIDQLGDLDHPLAAKLRAEVREYRKDIRQL